MLQETMAGGNTTSTAVWYLRQNNSESMNWREITLLHLYT